MNKLLRSAFYEKTKDFAPRTIVGAAFLCVFEEKQPTQKERLFEAEILKRVESADYFHGGLQGREVGDELLPSGSLGIDPHGWNDPDWRRQYVYFTANKGKAKVYSDRLNGAVYRVAPVGPVGLDIIDLRALLLAFSAPKIKRMNRKIGRDKTLAWLAGCLPLGYVCERATVLEVVHG